MRLVGILLASISLGYAAHGQDRMSERGEYLIEVGVVTDDNAPFYGSSTCHRHENCLIGLNTHLSVIVSFRAGHYDVQLLDFTPSRERCCLFENGSDHLTIEANVKHTESTLRIRKTDDFVFPARKDIPWGNYGKIFIKLEGAD